MMFSLSNATWVRLVLWSTIGVAIYFGYGRAARLEWRITSSYPPEGGSRHPAPSGWDAHRVRGAEMN